MSNCSQCGIEIPRGQSICSMCMGDINHGTDGYYLEEVYKQNLKEYEQYLESQQFNNLEEDEDLDEINYFENNID